MNQRTPRNDDWADAGNVALSRSLAGSGRGRWLAGYAWVLVALIFMLVVMGGNVTSTDAGMAFEDWPTTAGHNMLLTPLDVWWQTQAKFAEHSHRLMGALVGFLSIGLVIWLWIAYLRHGDRGLKHLAYLGSLLLGMVVVQGLMGGFRVTENSQFLAFIHGILGQCVLAAGVVTASVLSHTASRRTGTIAPVQKTDDHDNAHEQTQTNAQPTANRSRVHVRRLVWLMLGVFLLQLVLGSGVRHSGSAVAIPDFPMNYGRLIPPVSQSGLNSAMSARHMPTAPGEPGHYQLWQVWLHFAHRLGAVAVCLVSAYALWKLFQRLDWAEVLILPSILIICLLIIQVILGITTVLTQERPSVATLHQTIGAALLAAVTWLAVQVYFVSSPAD